MLRKDTSAIFFLRNFSKCFKVTQTKPLCDPGLFLSERKNCQLQAAIRRARLDSTLWIPDSRYWIRFNFGFWEPPTYPSPNLTLTLTSHFGQNDGLGEG